MRIRDAKWVAPLLQAVANGGTLQIWIGKEWRDQHDDAAVRFDGHEAEYRIKPTPRKLYVIEYQSVGSTEWGTYEILRLGTELEGARRKLHVVSTDNLSTGYSFRLSTFEETSSS